MKKILITLLLTALPTLSYSKDSEYLVTYSGTLWVGILSHIDFSKTNKYVCDIDKLGADYCKEKVESDAILACHKEIIDYVKTHKIKYRARQCEID